MGAKECKKEVTEIIFLVKNGEKLPGPSYSKLTMSLVNVVKTLIIKYGIYANIFVEKMWEAFAFAKFTRTVNILTTSLLS